MQKNNSKKKIVIILLLLIAIAIIVYFFITSYLSYKNQQEDISNYQDEIGTLSDSDLDDLQDELDDYNNNVLNNELNEENIDSEKIIGYINIPSISCYLPIYNNTRASSLLKGACKLEGTTNPSLNTWYHTVIVGHSGYTGRVLFTNLTKLDYNEVFYVTILDKTYEYRIDDIRRVLPEETDNLQTYEYDQKVTLITCVPVYINSHRLMVTGSYTGNVSSIFESDLSEERDYFLLLKLLLEIILVIILIIIIIKVIRCN